MSRIEDALRRLQSSPASARNAAATAQSAGARLARLTSDAPAGHQYGGKLVELDADQFKARGLLAPNAEERRLAEQYRAIKRPILRNASGRQEPLVERSNLLMVTSAIAGEGKTFTCLNLCLSIAREKDWTVVLVDGDCAKPQLTRLFGAERQPGFLDLLRDASLTFESLVMPTSVEGLALLPTGTHDQHSSELLGSDRMRKVCANLSTSDPNRMVIFDSSPMLLTTEAPILASHVGQVVVVVRADSTPREAVRAAVDKLDHTKAVSCVLNQTDSQMFGYDAYGYEYGYGGEQRPGDG
jgi:protein-tyrosine kinase